MLVQGLTKENNMKSKFYTVKMEFLVEAKDKDSARQMVVDHNFAKVMEHGNGWNNFTVGKIAKIKESKLV